MARAFPFGNKQALFVINTEGCNADLIPGSPFYSLDRFDAALKDIERLISHCRSTQIPVRFIRVVRRQLVHIEPFQSD